MPPSGRIPDLDRSASARQAVLDALEAGAYPAAAARIAGLDPRQLTRYLERCKASSEPRHIRFYSGYLRRLGAQLERASRLLIERDPKAWLERVDREHMGAPDTGLGTVRVVFEPALPAPPVNLLPEPESGPEPDTEDP